MLTDLPISIPCVLTCPDDGDIRRVVLSVHGLGGSTEDPIQCAIAEEMDFFRAATLRFDFPAHGENPENELTLGAGIELDPRTRGAFVDENCQTQVPGIFACGNVLQVHDLVDYVSEEAERAGIGAVKYIHEQCQNGAAIETKAGHGVRYVLPQTIGSRDADVSLFLRVTQPFGKVKFTVCDGDTVLASAKRLKAAPGEMEKLTVKADALKNVHGPITVSLEVL